MSRRRTLDFTGEPPRVDDTPRVTPLYFTLATMDGDTMTFDLTALPGNALTHDLAGAWQATWAGERWTTRRDASHLSKNAEFLTFVRALLAAGVARIEDIAGRHVDTYETDLRDRRALGTIVNHLSYLTRTLKQLPAERLRSDLLVRVQRVTYGDRPKPVPRDAYSDHVVDQLRAACRARITEVVRRLTVDADALVARSRDPRTVDISTLTVGRGRALGWQQPECLAWELNRAGPMSVRQWRERSGYTLPATSLTAVHHLLFPTNLDLAPFYLLLLLETGLPPSAALGLGVDCLRNPRPGYVDLPYYKPRARRAILESFRDGNVFTPGGLIRALLTVTRRLREHSAGRGGKPMTSLWVCYNKALARAQVERFVLDGEKSGWPRSHGDPVAQFVQNAGITDDDGKPMRVVQPSRLRKTHKRIWYERTHGQLEELAYDNTPQVAAAHYGDIPALRATHEQTAEDGIRDALAVGRTAGRPTVVTPADEERIAAGEAGVGGRLRQPLPVLQRLTAGTEQDVFLSACSNFFDSPFGERGQPCPVPTWRCLECDNAVVTPRKLPALILFLDRALGERAGLGEDLWRAKFGRVCERIEWDILPQYPAALLTESRAVAASGGALLWVPPGLFTASATGPVAVGDLA